MNHDVRPRRYHWRSGPRYRTVGGKQIVEILLLHAWAFEVSAGEAEKRRIQAFDTLDSLVSAGLPFQSTPDGRAFDPAEVINFVKCLALKDENSFWTDHCVSTGRRLAGQFRSGPGQPDLFQTRRFTFSLQRTFNLATLDRTKPVRLRLPLPIEDESLCDLMIDGVDAGPLDWSLSADRCRIDMRGTLPPPPTLSLGMRLSFKTETGRSFDRGEDWVRYLHSSEGHIQVTSRVQNLASYLSGTITSSRAIVACFWAFLIDHFICGVPHYDQVAAATTAIDWVLDTGWYDCQLGASLLAALCRARNIPARVVSGYLIYPIVASYHFWTEIWLGDEGWVPYDLLVWDLSAGGRDAAWRMHFAGCLEPRMKTQCLPLRFTGFLGTKFPTAWHILARRSRRGSETIFQTVDTGALVYSDEIKVDCFD